jgi:hypothetical protein
MLTFVPGNVVDLRHIFRISNAICGFDWMFQHEVLIESLNSQISIDNTCLRDISVVLSHLKRIVVTNLIGSIASTFKADDLASIYFICVDLS